MILARTRRPDALMPPAAAECGFERCWEEAPA